MKLEMALEKFELFADAPDAISQIRSFILHLAVTGKLVRQNDTEEPASLLLNMVASERAKMVASKSIKNRNGLTLSANDCPFPPPLGWEWAMLSEVGYELGQKVPGNRFCYVDVGSIDSDQGCISDRVEVLDPGSAPSRARKIVRTGTVIYSTVRPYLRNIAIIDRAFPEELIASTAFGILHPFSGIFNRYLFYWLRSDVFTAYVEASMKGMAYPAINDEKFYAGYIAVPPLAEQKRIVTKVDELMALCDLLEAQQRERDARHAVLARASLTRFATAPTTDNLQFLFHPSYAISPAELRSTILSLAVQGKLVHQNRDELFTDTFPEVTPSKFPLIVPSHWKWTEYGCIAVITGGFAFKSGDYSQSGVFVLRVTNIEPTGAINKDKAVFIPLDKVTGELARFYLNDGDLLLVMVGGSLGKTGFVTSDILPALLNQNLWRITPEVKEVDRIFLKLITDFTISFQRQIVYSTHGHLSRGDFRKKAVAIPPLAEQLRIVAKVDQLMALVDRYEAQLATARDTATQLLDALVAELTGTTRRARTTTSSAPMAELQHRTDDESDDALPENAGRHPDTKAAPITPEADSPATSRTGAQPSQDDDLDRLTVLLRERGSLSSSEAQAATNLDPATLRSHFKALIDCGLARAEGQRRGMRYKAL